MQRNSTMRHITIAKLHSDHMKAAVAAVRTNRISHSAAAAVFRITKSTLHEKVVRDGRLSFNHSQKILTADEAGVICVLLTKYADCRVPLTRKNLCDAVKILLKSLPFERLRILHFKFGRPELHYV